MRGDRHRAVGKQGAVRATGSKVVSAEGTVASAMTVVGGLMIVSAGIARSIRAVVVDSSTVWTESSPSRVRTRTMIAATATATPTSSPIVVGPTQLGQPLAGGRPPAGTPKPPMPVRGMVGGVIGGMPPGVSALDMTGSICMGSSASAEWFGGDADCGPVFAQTSASRLPSSDID